MYQVLTTLVLTLHFAYLAYVVVGGFLAWRWRRTIWLHLAATGWGLVIVANPWGWRCPLTDAERWSRQRAGQSGLEAGFVDQYLEGVLYPAQYTVLLQALAGLLVLGSWVGFYLRWRSARDTDRKSEDSSERTANV
ncbi:MAG: DUF2784 domain-containing protein [Natronosporangium sp.]